jgi:hypothetical protein
MWDFALFLVITFFALAAGISLTKSKFPSFILEEGSRRSITYVVILIASIGVGLLALVLVDHM